MTPILRGATDGFLLLIHGRKLALDLSELGDFQSDELTRASISLPKTRPFVSLSLVYFDAHGIR